MTRRTFFARTLGLLACGLAVQRAAKVVMKLGPNPATVYVFDGWPAIRQEIEAIEQEWKDLK